VQKKYMVLPENTQKNEPTAGAKKTKRGFQPTTVIVAFFMPAVENLYMCLRFTEGILKYSTYNEEQQG
jgi:hypothetical protein